jgi:hypothetical protein
MHLFELSTLVVNEELYAHQKRSFDVVNFGGSTIELLMRGVSQTKYVAEPTHLARSRVDR